MRTLRCGVDKHPRNECAIPASEGTELNYPRFKGPLLKELKSSALSGYGEATVYSYVVRSIGVGKNGVFAQNGCGPNFKGGLISLCTCMHQMRAGRTPEQWRSVWIAGFTSSTPDFSGHNWLVYLMQVRKAYPSHQELVTAFRKEGRSAALEAKAADNHSLGDIYIPKSKCRNPYDPNQYMRPNESHVHFRDANDKWEKDIDYWRWGRRPALLVGDGRHSYLWNRGLIKRQGKLSRNCSKSTLAEFLQALKSDAL